LAGLANVTLFVKNSLGADLIKASMRAARQADRELLEDGAMISTVHSLGVKSPS